MNNGLMKLVTSSRFCKYRLFDFLVHDVDECIEVLLGVSLSVIHTMLIAYVSTPTYILIFNVLLKI